MKPRAKIEPLGGRLAQLRERRVRNAEVVPTSRDAVPPRQEKFIVYVLRSETTGRFYIGHTNNLPKRLQYHNSGRTISGKKRGPWQVVYREMFPNRAAAARRERQMKNWKSHRYIELILQETARRGSEA